MNERYIHISNQIVGIMLVRVVADILDFQSWQDNVVLQLNMLIH